MLSRAYFRSIPMPGIFSISPPFINSTRPHIAVVIGGKVKKGGIIKIGLTNISTTADII